MNGFTKTANEIVLMKVTIQNITSNLSKVAERKP